MKHKLAYKLPVVIAVAITVAMATLLSTEIKAQGALSLRQPFSGTRRWTAYVDHRSPDYSEDGYMVVYLGEERGNCPDIGAAWNPVTQGPYCYDGHDGTDYSMPCGTPVLAAAEGIVSRVGTWYGYSIWINHVNGYSTRYAHLTEGSSLVNVGDPVAAGQQIALSGNTGTQNCHLHFGTYLNDEPTDPFGWRGDWPDPLPIDATCLWADTQCIDVVVEDESAWFTQNGGMGPRDWYWRGQSWTMRQKASTQGTPTASAWWRPNLPFDGPYTVYAFIPAEHATIQDAEYEIYARTGVYQVTVNQNQWYDAWVSLGTYDFPAGLGAAVYLDNVTHLGASTTAFDTIKFVQHRVYLPIVLKGEEACGEYIQNGGFEDGVTPWIFGGATLRTTRQAHSGNYSAWLGGYNNADDWMYQFVTLSGRATSATLSYWWYMETDEYTHPWDYLYVKIRNINGYDLRTLEVITDGNTANVWVPSSFDISEFIGQTIQVYYRATTDGSLITDFYIDDVSLQICPGMGQSATPMPTPTPSN